MKILILQDDYPPRARGGAAVVVAASARALVQAGAEVSVLTVVYEHAQAGESTEDGVTVIRAHIPAYHPRWRAYRALYNQAGVAAVREAIARINPDIVHAHNIHMHFSYASLRVAKKSGAKVFLTAHDVQAFNYGKLTSFINPRDTTIPHQFDYRVSAWQQFREQKWRYNPLRNLITRHILNSSVDRIMAVSNALKEALEQNGIRNIAVVHNGIDVGTWDESPADVYAWKVERGIGDKAIIFSGRLSGLKGAVPMMEALKLIVQKVADAQLLVVGARDAYAEKMLVHARELGVENRVVFTGWVSGRDLRLAYHAGAVFAVPSVCFDSFPTVNLEAFACGKPVVATCFGGSREIVEDGKSGYIVNPFNREMLATRLVELLADTRLSHSFGGVGKERLQKEFLLEGQVRKLLSLYGETVAK